MAGDTNSTAKLPPERDGAPPLLDSCPFCDYALEGHPVDAVCPECGNRVDRRWRVFGGTKLKPVFNRAIGWVVACQVALVCLMMIATGIGLNKPPPWWLLGVWGGVFVLLWFVLFRRTRAFIALAPDGLVVCRRPPVLERHAWAGLGRARYSMMSKSIEIEAPDKPLRIPIYAPFRGDVAAAESCARAINAFPRNPDASAPRP